MSRRRSSVRVRRGRWAAITSAAVAAVVLAAVLLTRGSSATPPPCRGTLIPAYGPASVLAGLSGHPGRRRLVIVNPASGPGQQPQPSYREAITTARKNGARVLGYVPTAYGARDPSAVAADIDRYQAWYRTDGIFLDEVASDPERLGYYEAISRQVRSGADRILVLNPGRVPAPGYAELADVIVTFEGPFADYARALQEMPPWVRALPPARVAHLVYGASAAEAAASIHTDAQAGHLYMTSGSPPNPWQALSPYLDDQEKQLARCPGA
jgi:hypothetical protein